MAKQTTPTAVPQAVLVAMDFSPGAHRALEVALSWCPRGEVTALHVLDSDFAGRIEQQGLGSSAEVLTRLRSRADEAFGWLLDEKGAEAFAPMIVEGIPFVEIVKVASDLDVDLIAMGMHRHAPRVDRLLFGSTAEKVMRTSSRPVLCVP
ncbi:universal stress protein [Candidatus Binatia bacterium]|nr:universal stress protein [Candidatus Binatia bacterium]